MIQRLPENRSLALVAGTTFTCGALYILLDDLLRGHPWSMDHVLTVVTLFGTIAVGHLAVEAGRNRQLLAAIGFGFLFLSGTALTVYNSVGRQAETSDAKLLSAEARNEQIGATRRSHQANSAMLSEARERHARECASGRGKRCDGIAATIRVYEDAVKGNDADLVKLGPPIPVAPKAEKMASVAAIFGADKVQAKALLMLIEPFAYTLFFELGSIISLAYGFGGHRNSRAQQERSTSYEVAERAQATEPHPSNLGKRLRNGCHVAAAVSKESAQRDLIARLATGATVAAQDDLADAWNVNKGTVSKWVAEWERNGAIPARQQIGRCKTIRQTTWAG